MTKPPHLLTALAVAAALAVAGCGDDDDDETTTPSGATGATGAAGAGLLPADFIADADAICKEGDEEIDAEIERLFGGGGKPTKAEQEQVVTDSVIPGIQDQIDGLRDLGEPDEGADELSAFIDDAQAALDEIEADPSLLTERGQGDPFGDVQDQARELGLRDCASD